MVAMNTLTVNETRFVYSTQGVDDVRAKADALAKAQTGVAKSSDAAAASNAGVEKSTRSTADAFGRAGAAAADAAQKQAVLERAQRQIQASMLQAAAGADAFDRSLSAVADAQERAVQASAQVGRASNDNVAALNRESEAYRSAGKFAAEHPVLVLAGSVAAARGLTTLSTTAAASLNSASASTAKYAAAAAEMGSSTATGAALAAQALALGSRAAQSAAGGFTAYADSVSGMTTTVGLFSRALSIVPAAFVPIAAGLAVFAAGAAGIEKAYADLDKLVTLGRQAEQLAVSAPFLKSFTGLGAQLRLEVDQMQAALAKASSFVQDRYGQASAASRAFGDIPGGTQLQAAQQLALAQTTDERIRAVLSGMAELEASGQRLAAINVGEKVFGPDLIDRLKRGETSIAQFAADLEQARGKEVLSQADVTRALELTRQIEDVKREINQAMASTLDFSGAAMRLNGAWLEVLKPIRDVAKAVADATSGGDAATLRTIQGLQARASSIETVSIPRAVNQGDASVVASLREQVVGLQGEIDRLSSTMTSAADKITADVGRVPPPLRLMSDELASLVSAADQAARSMDSTASSATNAGSALSSAAVKARDFSDALRSIQAVNPNLAGTLSLVDRIGKINQTVTEGVKGVTEKFNSGALGDGEAQQQIRKLNDEAAASIKALRSEADKPFTGYVREAEISKLDDLGQSLARAGDRYGDLKQKAMDAYKVESEAATTDAGRAEAEKRKIERLTQLDGAYKQVQSSARKAAADRAASSAGAEKEAGADAYDNAIQRTKDQIQEFNLQASAADKASEEVYKLMEANRLRRAAASAGRSDEAGIADAIDAQAAAYARARKASEDAIEAQRRLQEGQREIAQDFSQFAEDILLGGTKIGDAFASLAKTFSSSALKALLTGQGGLAGIFGTAGEKSGDLGGLFGGKLNLNLGSLFGGGSDAANSPLPGAQGPSLPSSSLFGGLFDGDKITKALNGGAESGIGSALSNALKPKAGGGILTSPLGGAIATVGAGAAIGYSSQSPLIGAAGGALAGLATGNPVMALAGGAAGLLGGILGGDQAKKQAKKQLQQELQARREAYDQAKPQIEALDKTFLGESIGAVGSKITEAEVQLKQAAKAASDAGDSARANQLVADFQKYVARMVATFAEGFNGVRAEIEAGFGTSGPFSTALGAVQTLGESLKAFVADAGRLSDPSLGNLARASAVQGALSSLNPTPTLSATQSELARINGTATGLNQVLKDLGLSAEQAAAAIKDGTTKALDALRDKFTDDLGRKINDAQNKGYLNDASDLLKEVASLQQDASAIGGDLGQVDTYFTAAAQKIVDGSELAGGAFDELIAKFPELAGRVREYSETASMSADQAAKAAADALAQIQDRKRAYEDRAVAVNFGDDSLRSKLLTFDRSAEWEQWQEMAKGGQALDELISAQLLERNKLIADYNAAVKERKLNFQDRTFAATNDTSTLAGQLSAYDRQAQREREDEVKAGGEALAQLEQAQYAERLKIITDFQKQANEAAKQQLAAAQSAFETFVKNIKTYLDNLRAGASSPLSPKDRLAAAQSQYDAQLALAKGGDRTALDNITQYSDTLLEASKAYNASGEAYQATFQKIVADLQALPTQVSAEQFIVDAIKSSGDAIVSATDTMRAALLAGIQANSPPLIATALLQNFQMLDTSVNGLLDQGEFLAGLGPLATAEEQRQAKAIFNAIDTNGDGQLSKLELQNASSYRVEQYTAATNSNVDTGNSISNAQKATMDSQANLLNSINSLTNSQLATQQQLVNLNNSNNTQNSFIQTNTGYTNDLITRQYGTQAGIYDLTVSMLNNLRAANQKNGAGVFATGGWVSGPGTGTSDSISARLSNGEFVVNAASARLNGPLLEALNDNRSIGMPAVAMPMPVAVSSNRNDGALIAEVRALRAELAGVKAAVKENTDVAEAGHIGTMGAVRSNTAAVQDGNAVASRQTLAKKVA